MNKIFKVIWNKAKHCYVVASELAKSYTKGGGSRSIRRACAALCIATAVYAASGSALANSGGHTDRNDYIGDSPNYNVTIDSGLDGNVYGRKEDNDTSENATVTFINGTKDTVYGGWSRLGNAASNSVSISGGYVNKNVYGGYVNSGSGSAASNSVNISGGTLEDVYGGYVNSGTGSAASNSVNISGGIIGEVDYTVNVYGGYTNSGTASSNSVNISDGTINATVCGGFSISGISASNSVNISGGTIWEKVYGGYSNEGNAASNSVNISGGELFDVCGGFSDEGNAASNSVNISGGKIRNNVYGGYSYSGDAASNSVNISGGELIDVCGGFSDEGNAASNSVNISGGTIKLHAIGGFSDEGNAASNSVNISGGTIELYAIGGYSHSGDAASNSVTITGGTINDEVVGGKTYIGKAKTNIVNIGGGEVNTVYGGYSDNTGIITSNNVNIIGGLVHNNVYGGYTNSGTASSNSVNISDGTINATVCGGFSISGISASNSVNISGGNVNSFVSGGYSYSGEAASNSVNISGGKIKQVYGGYSISGTTASNSVNILSGIIEQDVYGAYSETGEVTSNSANISGGSMGNVIGGYSYNNKSASNSVNISGGSIKNVYGGYSHESNAVYNTTIISGDTTLISEEAYGGKSYFGNAESNSAIISGGNIKSATGGYSYLSDAASNSVNVSAGSLKMVLGGYSYSGNTLDNSVDISGGTVEEVIYGGFISSKSGESGDSIGNSVSISGDTTSITGYVFGGLSQSGKAASNSVIISGGTVDYNVCGGSSNSGENTNNSVIINGGTIEQIVYGGSSNSGDTLCNSVNISGGTVKYYIYGGSSVSGNVASNSVCIDGDSTLITGYVFGGYSDNHNVTGNSVNMSNGTVDTYVFGGYSLTADAIGNSANLSGGTVNLALFGGYSNSGNAASNNSANISGGIVKDVIGGEAFSGNAANNYVNISGGTFGSESKIYAGYVYEPNNSTISDNIVNLSGTVAGLNNAEIYGYYFKNGSGTHSGNELHIGRAVDYDDEDNIQRDSEGNIKYKSDSSTTWYGKSSDGTANNSINKIANFETLALHSVAWDNDLPAIKAVTLENIGTVDVTDLKFYENNSEKTSFTPGDKMNLITWENETESLINLRYKLDGTGDEQTVAFSDNPNGISVKTVPVSEKDKGISFEGTSSGNINKVDKALQIYFTGITLNSINLSDWDGKSSSEFPSGWSLNADGIDVSGVFEDPELSAGESINILTASTNVFKDEKIDEAIRYRNDNFKDESGKGVTLSGIHIGGVKASDDGKTLTYHAIFNDVTSFKLASVAWEDGAELLSREKYNYSKLTTLDTEDFNITYEKPETITVNQSMTLLNANNTLADMAEMEKSVTYQYEPLAGVTMDAVIRSSLAAKSGKVTLTTLSNKADKLTFGNIEWLDKGALIDHKTILNNVSFDGADVDTTKIAFINKDNMKANSKMTLVSDFGDSVGTITGSKYKVGTAYEGEGSAYLKGSDLVFKTKTSAGLSDETHTTVMAMEAGIAALAAGNDHIGTVMESLEMASNKGSDGVSTAASVGGGSSRYETGSHVDTNSWNIAVAVGKNLEKKDGTMEYGLFGEYGRGNYTLHMNGIEDAGSGNTHYTGGGFLLKWTNSHDVYTEASFRMGSLKDKASSLLHDGAGNAYGYDTSAKYRGGHIGFGKTYKEEDNTKLDIYGKYFYNEREGINFAAGADQYSLDKVRSRVLRAGFRLSSTDKKWNRYGGLSYDYEFGGKSSGTVNGTPIRSASVKGGTLRGEFGYCREATKTNPWKTDISLYGFTGKRQGFGGSVAVEYHF